MIPKTLAEFRELMQRACETAYYSSCDVLAEEGERMRDKMDADALRSLSTATPEQLLGIVMGWQPIETAPRDNARPLLLAQFDETGTLVTADYNGEWADTTGRWAFPQGFCWVSENGHAGQPTHWLPQPEWFTQLPREAPGEG